MKKPEDEYRRCASVLLFRRTEKEGVQFLLVRKPRKKDAWQLPQGGAEEGENIEQAARRELWEETNVQTDILGKSAISYMYDFPKSYQRFRPDHICGQCIQFVFAEADPFVQVRVDQKEIEAYAWVLPKQLSRYVKRKEYRKIVEKLVEEGMVLLEKRSYIQ